MDTSAKNATRCVNATSSTANTVIQKLVSAVASQDGMKIYVNEVALIRPMGHLAHKTASAKMDLRATP